MVKLNRPVTGPDNVLRVPDVDYTDLPQGLEDDYRARGLLDEGDPDPNAVTERNLRASGTAQLIAGVDPHNGLQARGPVRGSTGPADRGSAPGANDAGLPLAENEARTAEQTRINEATVSTGGASTSLAVGSTGPSSSGADGDEGRAKEARLDSGEAEGMVGEKMAGGAPANKARSPRATK